MSNKLKMLGLSASLVMGCTNTTVVLVPDAGGKVGEVTVQNEAGSTVLSKAYESAEAGILNKAPAKPDTLGIATTRKLFSDTLAVEPVPPKRFALYFDMGSAKLKKDSLPEIAKINAEIQARKLCDVSVIGHTDRVWDSENNLVLSLKRANTVAETLAKNGVNYLCLTLRYYGEHDPAIHTDDEVAEPRNRRVEVEVR